MGVKIAFGLTADQAIQLERLSGWAWSDLEADQAATVSQMHHQSAAAGFRALELLAHAIEEALRSLKEGR